ncbi:hypothetical protein ABTK62_20205, partial [Acinetobacter baumannii]
AARHAGVRALHLAWQHDAMRARDVAEGGELTVATADTTRDLPRLTRLLAEHLARTTLAAPAGEITRWGVFRHPQVVLGALALFGYVGVEV